MKKKRFSGMVMNERGELVTGEMFGPATIVIWESSWNLFRTGAISLKIATTGRLRQYANFIKSLAAQYPHVWALIYQAEVRMRTERFPLILAKLEDKHEEAVLKNHPTSFDPQMPWDSVLAYAVEFEDAWWYRNVREPAQNVRTGAVPISEYVDDDARISRQRPHIPTGSETMAEVPTYADGNPGAGGKGGKRTWSQTGGKGEWANRKKRRGGGQQQQWSNKGQPQYQQPLRPGEDQGTMPRLQRGNLPCYYGWQYLCY